MEPDLGGQEKVEIHRYKVILVESQWSLTLEVRKRWRSTATR